MVVVRRVWDRRQCPLLQPGDAIMKINGADVQSFSFSQVVPLTRESDRADQDLDHNNRCISFLRSSESYRNTPNKEMWCSWSTEEVPLSPGLQPDPSS